MNHNSLTMAEYDWGEALNRDSVQVLDETRGIIVCSVIMNGSAKPVLQQGALRMIITDEIIDGLMVWRERRKGVTS